VKWLVEARKAAEQNQLERALQFLEKALELQPESAPTLISVAIIHQNARRFEKAIEVLERILAFEPKNKDAWYRKADNLEDLGRLSEALRCYDKALEIDPVFVDAWVDKGYLLGRMKRQEESLACAEKAIALDCGHPTAWFNKAGHEDLLGRMQDAARSYRVFLDLPKKGPRDYSKDVDYAQRRLRELGGPPAPGGGAQELFQGGMSALQSGKPAEAERLLARALALQPNATKAWHARGACLEELGRHSEALDCYERGIGVDPNAAPLWGGKGIALYALGRLEEALKALGRSLELEPKLEFVWFKKGNVLSRLKRHEEAIACYDQCLKLKPGQAEVVINRAYAFFDLERYEETLKALEGCDPTNPDVWLTRGSCLRRLGRREEAVAAFEKATALDTRHRRAWTNWAELWEEQGRHAQALKVWKSMLEALPGDPAALERRALCLEKLGLKEEAEEVRRQLTDRREMSPEEELVLADQEFERNPRSIPALLARGHALHRLKRFDECLECLDKAIALDPGDESLKARRDIMARMVQLRREKPA